MNYIIEHLKRHEDKLRRFCKQKRAEQDDHEELKQCSEAISYLIEKMKSSSRIIEGTETKPPKPLTQCMMGRDAECNHPQCPISEKDVCNGIKCELPLYDWRQ